MVTLDWFTKIWVSKNLPTIRPFSNYPFGGIDVVSSQAIKFSIVHTTNTGVAWGMFSGFPLAIAIFRILITLILLCYIFSIKSAKSVANSLILIAAGAIGNIIDYFVHGHVVDMFYFIFWNYSFPVFNLADAAIFFGVISISLKKKRKLVA